MHPRQAHSQLCQWDTLPLVRSPPQAQSLVGETISSSRSATHPRRAHSQLCQWVILPLVRSPPLAQSLVGEAMPTSRSAMHPRQAHSQLCRWVKLLLVRSPPLAQSPAGKMICSSRSALRPNTASDTCRHASDWSFSALVYGLLRVDFRSFVAGKLGLSNADTKLTSTIECLTREIKILLLVYGNLGYKLVITIHSAFFHKS